MYLVYFRSFMKYEKFEDANGVIKSRKSKNRQRNSQRKTENMTKNGRHYTIQKTKRLRNRNPTENRG
jgi:hypothetical protein